MLVLIGIYYHYIPLKVLDKRSVYVNDHEKAIEEAFKTYLKAKMATADYKIPLVPIFF